MKRFWKVIVGITLAASMFAGCSQTAQTPDETELSAQTTEEQSVQTSEESAEETTSEEITPEEETASSVSENLFGAAFSIESKEDGIKIVTDGDNRELVLVPKELGEVPAEYSDSIVIRTPVDNAVMLSSTQACTFRAFDDEELVASVGGVTGFAESWTDIPAISEGLANGDIISVGDGMSEPDYELIASLSPDVVFVYGGPFGQTDIMAKLDELGINYAVDNEYLESNYLARMEWMRFILTFFNADNEAYSYMYSVSEEMHDIKASLEGLESPKAAIFSVYGGAVYATSDESWSGSMLADMGGINVFSGTDVNNLSAEEAYALIADADVIIYTSTPSYCNGMAALMDEFPQLSECKAYENDRVYQYGEGFWNSIDQTNGVAADLAAVLHPDAFSDSILTYYVKLEK